MIESVKKLVVCRQAADQHAPLSTVGYYCDFCKKELQVSPEGVARIKEGGIPLCNPCGFKIAEQMQLRGKVAGIELLPNAVEYLRELDKNVNH